MSDEQNSQTPPPPQLPKKNVPVVILKLTNANIFNVEVDFQCSTNCARAMLYEALQTLNFLIDNEHRMKMAQQLRTAMSMQKQ